MTLLFILCTLIGAVVSRHLHSTNRGEYAIRLDRRLAASSFLLYTAVNAFMIVSAAYSS